MTFDDKLDKILLSHGAEQGELHYSLKQSIKDLVLRDVVGEDEQVQYIDDQPATELDDYAETRNDFREHARLIIDGKESSNE